jgi:iron complex transport system substrate-binding protein
VAALGHLPQLVGRTHECDWPATVSSVPVVATTSVDQNTLSSREISLSTAHQGSSLSGLWLPTWSCPVWTLCFVLGK